MPKDYLNNLRIAMLDIIETKLKELGLFSSANYQFLNKSLEELEMMLMEEAEQKNLEKCSEIKKEIRTRIKQPKSVQK